jgi:hypothetical protein
MGESMNKINELKDTMQYIFNFWFDAGIVLHKGLNDRTKSKIKSALKNYSVQEIKEAILNYAEILHSDNYYWSYVWTLSEFMSRGIPKFLTEACPFSNFSTEKHKINRGKTEAHKGFSNFKNDFKKWKQAEQNNRR